MANFCKYCGGKLNPGERFCGGCGHRIDVVSENTTKLLNYCKYCGEKLIPGAKFCRGCGHMIDGASGIIEKSTNNPQYNMMPVLVEKPATYNKTAGAEHQSRKDKPQSSGRHVFTLVINILLSVVMAAECLAVCFWQPGFLRKKKSDSISDQEEFFSSITDEDMEEYEEEFSLCTGVSSIVFDPSSVTPEMVSVSYDDREASYDNGVYVCFDEFCVGEEAQSLEMRSLGTRSDEDFDAVGFDFTLDGQETEFFGLVQLSLPYEQSWGENVFVQYYNVETGSWEIIYAEPDGNGHMTFYTDHFCTFAVFKEKVEGSSGNSSRPIFKEVPGNNEYDLKVHICWDNLAAKVRENKLAGNDKISSLGNSSNPYFADRTLTILNNANTGLDFIAKAAKMQGLSDNLFGPLGQSLTIGKFLYQGHKYGWSKAWKDNWSDLGILVVGAYSSTATPAGIVCLAISAGYYLYSMTDAVKNDIKNGFFDNSTECAYRDFTRQYLIYKPKKGLVSVYYEPDVVTAYDRNYFPYGWYPMPVGRADANWDKDTCQWMKVFEDAMEYQKQGKGSAKEYVMSVIDQYCNAFWKYSDARERFLKDHKADYPYYQTPDKDKQDQYTKNMKEYLCAVLKPLFDKLMEIQYQQNLNAIYMYFLNLYTAMNETYTLQLVDPKHEDFSEGEFADYSIGLATDEKSRPGIYTDRKSGTVSFTGAAWMKAGCPGVLRVIGTPKDKNNSDKNYFVKQLKLKPGLNTVYLYVQQEQSSKGFKLKDIEGTWYSPSADYGLVINTKNDHYSYYNLTDSYSSTEGYSFDSSKGALTLSGPYSENYAPHTITIEIIDKKTIRIVEDDVILRKV